MNGDYAKILRRLEVLEKHYDTGWVACSDWTNQHLGDTVGGNVTHNLNAPLSKLRVGMFISTDGTDANSFAIVYYTDSGSGAYGITIFQVDANTITVQTGTTGIPYVKNDGTGSVIDIENYYYKVKVWYAG